MHCGNREATHGKGDRNYESSSRGKWGFASSSSSCFGTAAAAAFPSSCTHQSGAQLGPGEPEKTSQRAREIIRNGIVGEP
jgi:hypothetical protein